MAKSTEQSRVPEAMGYDKFVYKGNSLISIFRCFSFQAIVSKRFKMKVHQYRMSTSAGCTCTDGDEHPEIQLL